jgi:hypothetical protein
LLELGLDDLLNSIEKVNRDDAPGNGTIRYSLKRMLSSEPPDVFDNSSGSFSRTVSSNVETNSARASMERLLLRVRVISIDVGKVCDSGNVLRQIPERVIDAA